MPTSYRPYESGQVMLLPAAPQHWPPPVHPTERLVPAQRVPQRVQHPGVAHRQRRGKAYRGRLRRLAANGAVQPANQGIGPTSAHLLQAAKGGVNALAGRFLIIAIATTSLT